MAEIVITGISLTVDTSNVTTAKEERTVRFSIPTINVELESSDGEAEEVRVHSKVQPLQLLKKQKSDLKI